MTFRDIQWMLIVKSAWLTAVFAIWLMGLGSCMTEPQCWFAGYTLLPFIFLLSFPGSLLFLIFNGILIGLGLAFGVSAPFQYTYFAMGAIASGYLQWFHLVPAIFGKRKLTILSLSKREIFPLAEPELKLQTPAMQAVSPMQALAFDKSGRSPLERAIDKRRRRLTNVS